MSSRYEHTQPGYVTLGALGGAASVLVGIAVRKAATAGALPALLALGVLGAVFSSLTVVVTDEELLVRFGPGLTVKRLGLDAITSVQLVRNPWYYGFGIRFTPRGMLYNVSGLDAVEVTTQGGRSFRVGTDEPELLIRALEEAVARK